MRRLSRSEMTKVAGGQKYDQLLAKANERYYGGHPSGDGLAVATTRPS